MTVRKLTGMTPYRVIFGQECLHPVEIMMESTRVVDWLQVEREGNRTEELLGIRTGQLERRPKDIDKAVEVQWKSPEENRKYFDKH